MAQDFIQQTLEHLALTDTVTRQIAVILAVYLVFAMAIAWVGITLWRSRHISLAAIVRVVLLVALAGVLSRITGHLVSDPRPYLATHTAALTDVSRDNGFPSDHVLLASALTASLWWIWRRAIPLFALGTLLVMMGRMAVGAHHTLDVAGSVAIVTFAALLVALLPLPSTWRHPLLGSRAEAGSAGR